MAHRSLHIVTKVYYRSMSFFATDSLAKGPVCNVKDSLAKGPSCTKWDRHFIKYVIKCVTKYGVIPHPTEQDTLLIAFLISRQGIPYWTHGVTCCPRVSTPKIRSVADSSTTCHDGINHLHHTNHCSNHIIDPHTINSHLNRWKTITLSQR
jgi:hypothetical protein